MSLNGNSASCEMYVLAGSLGDILHTGEVCHVVIKTNCLLRSWEKPADFRTVSTALLIREIAVNLNPGRLDATWLLCGVLKCSHIMCGRRRSSDTPRRKMGWPDSPILPVLISMQCFFKCCGLVYWPHPHITRNYNMSIFVRENMFKPWGSITVVAQQPPVQAALWLFGIFCTYKMKMAPHHSGCRLAVLCVHIVPL